jgi:hypothetical protein
MPSLFSTLRSSTRCLSSFSLIIFIEELSLTEDSAILLDLAVLS